MNHSRIHMTRNMRNYVAEHVRMKASAGIGAKAMKWKEEKYLYENAWWQCHRQVPTADPIGYVADCVIHSWRQWKIGSGALSRRR